MSKIQKTAQAGTVESSDIMIVLAPVQTGSGLTIEVVTPAMKQYGAQIKEIIVKTLVAQGIEDAHVHAIDKGALDYTIEARVMTAISRALEAGEEKS
ncbi:citrate lyase acyl carrier protein [Pelosinus sp. UFO1]|uniref:citrate lyase acyl carrier protein n=1 Tax=Pelosinus sp. UFO1 TaxID=484770 RepID=UPI0004D1D6AB|nr:citrate lyase acyl carrier protein [Pelosinus sp. UFO1]AIF50761.1 citrate lyase acyl carrier protein [Pelosinus sp. UFO1]